MMAEAMQHGASVTDNQTANVAVVRPVTWETKFHTYSFDGYCEVTVSGPCDTCGRTVTVVEGAGQYFRRLHLFCSGRCRGLHYNHVRGERGARAREKVCGVCGEEFTAKRVDAKTCSPACKQKAYRRRRATN
jgi:predicted nucleic acid-binding Zn ribbon protein